MEKNPVKPLSPAVLLLIAGFSGFGCGAELEDGALRDEGLGQTQQSLILSNQELRSGVAPDRCLDVSGGVAAAGTNVQSHQCNGTNAQKWTLSPAGELKSALNSSFCLDVSGGGTAPDTNVQIYPCNGTNAQKWTPTEKGELRSAVAPDRCLDVSGAGTASGTNVQIYPCNGTKAQQWFKVPTLPVSSTNQVPITISSAQFSNGTNRLVNVLPGQQLSLKVGYSIQQDSGCPSCVDQILIGFSGASQAQACAYSGNPGLSGTSGISTVSLTAPTTPGVYYVRFRYAQALGCDVSWWTVNGAPGESNDIAVIAVQ